MACRALIQLTILMFILLMYPAFWMYCQSCIWGLASISCLAYVLGSPLMVPACAVGLFSILMQGIQYGLGGLHITVKYDS